MEKGKSVRLADERMIREAIGALQADVSNKTYEDTVSKKPGWASITLYLPKNRQFELEWEQSFTNFEAWLKKSGQYEKARLMPADVQYILVVKGNEEQDWTKNIRSSRQYVLEMEKQPGCLKITDPPSIEACLLITTPKNSHIGRPLYSKMIILCSGDLNRKTPQALW